MHEDWDWSDPCDAPCWKAESPDRYGWGDKWVSGMTDPLDHGIWGQPGAIRITLLHRWSDSLLITLPSNDAGGRHTCLGPPRRLLEHPLPKHLGLVLRTQTWSVCNCTWIIWPCQDSFSAITFMQPGMCLAFKTICLRLHQHRSHQRMAQSEPDLLPPSLFMYVTTVVLSVATRTIWPCAMCWNLFRDNKTAFNYRKFMCSLLSGTD